MQGKNKCNLNSQETMVPCLDWKLVWMSHRHTLMGSNDVSHDVILDNLQDTLRDLNLYFVNLLFFIRAVVS